MMRTFGVSLVVAMGLMSGAAGAASKAESCGYQAQVAGAIQQARLDRVRERKVEAHVKAAATWPENYNTAITLMVPWVYEMKMRDVRKQDLAAAWKELCLQQ